MIRLARGIGMVAVVLLLCGGTVLAREGKTPREDPGWDASDVPGAVIDAQQPLTAEQEALLKGSVEEPTLQGSQMEQIWKESGYDRPVGPEEKEKRPETIFGGQYDIQDEMKKIREGSY